MSEIVSIEGLEILDSRGFPTVQALVKLRSGEQAWACVPSGASTGSKEAIELRDLGTRYLGKGTQKAVSNINELIGPSLQGKSVADQNAIDQILLDLDGTSNKSHLGANAMLAVSLACAKVAAKASDLPFFHHLALNNPFTSMSLPVPMFNVLNGGAHADNNVDIQEFMCLPIHAPSFAEAMRIGVEIYHCLKKHLLSKGLSTGVGDEGGFAPDLTSNTHAIELLLEAIVQAGYTPGKDVVLALDCASGEFFHQGQYHLKSENQVLDSNGLIDLYADWIRQYPIISIEDGLDENDWSGWQTLTQTLGKKIQLVGDDLFVTNSEILQKGIHQHCANAILIKLNQIGTLSQTLTAISMAQNEGYNPIISHRSGETEDASISDLAVACGAGQIKTGAPCRGERIAKYNQLLRIEAMMPNIPYAGANSLLRWVNA